MALIRVVLLLQLVLGLGARAALGSTWQHMAVRLTDEFCCAHIYWMVSPCRYMREFVHNHPDYKRDSVVSEQVSQSFTGTRSLIKLDWFSALSRTALVLYCVCDRAVLVLCVW